MALPNARVQEAFEKFVMNLEIERHQQSLNLDISAESPTSPASSVCASPRHVPLSFRRKWCSSSRSHSRSRSPLPCNGGPDLRSVSPARRNHPSNSLGRDALARVAINPRDEYLQAELSKLTEQIKVDVMKAISQALKDTSQLAHTLHDRAANQLESHDTEAPACFHNTVARPPLKSDCAGLSSSLFKTSSGDEATDLQVLQSAEQILEAMDACASKPGELPGTAKANVTLTFCPQPSIVTAHALNCRVRAMGVNLCDKVTENSCRFPRGLLGGQRGQPSITIFWTSTHKITVQVHAKKANVVLKGRRSAFSHPVLRKFVPFLGAPVSAITNAGSEI